MIIKRPDDIRASDVTDRTGFENRRAFLRGGAALAMASRSVNNGAGLPCSNAILPPR